MLDDYLDRNRATLIGRCRAKVAARRAPEAAEHELWYGIPVFVDQVISALRLDPLSGASNTDMARIRTSSWNIGGTAAQHGNELLRSGFTVSQVVHDYGDLCQAITDLAIEQNATISVAEFRTLNRCLDLAIADAVTEFSRQREELWSGAAITPANERLGFLGHELRNLIGTAILALATVKKGGVGLGGATGALLDRTLIGLRDLVDRTLFEVRLSAGIPPRRERIVVRQFIGEAEDAAALDAAARHVELVVVPISADLAIEGDRQILAAALVNVLQNAVKFTRPDSRVSLKAYATGDRVLIDVEDRCGGLPDGKLDNLFRPFEQRGVERTGLGLGLPISRRGVEANGGTLRVHDLPGTGCVFSIDLPLAS